MAILIDFNQVVIGSYMALHKSTKSRSFMPARRVGDAPEKVEMDTPLVRHIVLNNLRDIRKRFHKEYGELVICCDGRNYWRKKIYPYYKAHRAAGRDAVAEATDLDWNKLFEALDTIRRELRETFPYKILHIDGAESDDCIATVIKFLQNKSSNDFFGPQDGEKCLIVSSDHDFRQLQIYKNVRQWAPKDKKFVDEPSPAKYLREHVFCGDSGDGIPNVLSPDNCFVDKIRQTPMTKKRLEELMNMNDPEKELEGDVLKNYKRNKQMCDLVNGVPAEIETKILEEFNKPVTGARKKIMMYFMQNRMKNLMSSIGDF